MTGWKNWSVGEVVEATDFQTYVQDQVIQNYAGTAARATALGTSVAEGMVSYLADTNTLEFYDGAAWQPVGSEGDITAVTAGTGLTGGGTGGSVTLNADYAAIGSAVTILASQVTDITATASELNILDGATVTASELNILDGATITTAELNTLDGITATVTELNYTDGVTSAIQTQLDGKVSTTNGAVTTADTGSNVVRNITLSTATPTGGSDGDVWLVYTA